MQNYCAKTGVHINLIIYWCCDDVDQTVTIIMLFDLFILNYFPDLLCGELVH